MSEENNLEAVRPMTTSNDESELMHYGILRKSGRYRTRGVAARMYIPAA